AVLVGVSGIAAHHAQIVVEDVVRVLHLNGPRARAHDAGQAVDLNVVRLVGNNAVPVLLVHPAFVGGRILRPVVNNRAAAQHLHMIHLPQVYTAEEVRAGSKIDGLPALGADALVIDTGAVDLDVRVRR